MKPLCLAVAVAILALSGCGADTPTSPSQVVSVPTPTPAPSFPSALGSWTGTITNTALGASSVCNTSWLITAQAGGSFSGTFQVSGGLGCSQSGNLNGTVTTAGGFTFGLVTTIGNGSVCTDSNISSSGLISGATIAYQSTFTRSCTTSAPFVESQSINLTRH